MARLGFPSWVRELHWESHRLPRTWVVPGDSPTPFDFSRQMTRIVSDIASRSPEFGHLDCRSMLITAIPSRNCSLHGLQARVTPLRFRQGTRWRLHRQTVYEVQRYRVDQQDILYLVSFSLPRFLNQTYEEKWVTIFHELYHISPAFDGDLRRHEGRYSMHTRSRRQYDRLMYDMARSYLTDHPDPELVAFLRYSAAELGRRYGGVTAITVPQPKMIPADLSRSDSHRSPNSVGTFSRKCSIS